MATVALTNDTFGQFVANSDKPVLVDFWAPWCQPCQFLGPILEEMSTEMADKMIVAKVNVDEHPDCASRYGVMSIPTMILFSDGVQAHAFVGAMRKDDLVAEFADFL